jgi:hypothetical protein
MEGRGDRDSVLSRAINASEIAAALISKADELLAAPPEILAADVLARK